MESQTGREGQKEINRKGDKGKAGSEDRKRQRAEGGRSGGRQTQTDAWV